MTNYGGKANSLLKLKENNFNLPDFFIIDEEDYQKFLKENNLTDNIIELIKKKQHKEIEPLIKK